MRSTASYTASPTYEALEVDFEEAFRDKKRVIRSRFLILFQVVEEPLAQLFPLSAS